jgi:hypothetical protein
MKLKSFCITKEMISKLKSLPTEWEKIFASCTSDKGLMIRIYRLLKKLNSQKINDPMKKWANELNGAFTKEEVQMAKKHMKKCSPTMAIKEMQIKTTLRFHFTPVRIATIKNTKKKKKKRNMQLIKKKEHKEQQISVRTWGKGTLIHCWWEC